MKTYCLMSRKGHLVISSLAHNRKDVVSFPRRIWGMGAVAVKKSGYRVVEVEISLK